MARHWHNLTAPQATAVALPDVFDYLRLSHSDDIEQVEAYLAAATDMAEGYTGRAFINREMVMGLDRFPTWGIELPRPPLAAVHAVEYVDGDGMLQTLDPSQYVVDALSCPGRIVGRNGWPAVRHDTPSAVRVTFTAGYGESAANVPAAIQQAIRFMVAHFYETRVPVVTGTIATKIPLSAEYLLQQYKVYTL